MAALYSRTESEASVPRGARHVVLGCAVLCCAVLQGCSFPGRGPAVPEDLTARAEIPGIEGVRYFPDFDTDRFVEDAIASKKRHMAYRERSEPQGEVAAFQYLAISGGGDNGAFGAGVLVGWAEHGSRPEFEVVTGISTGALLAPFAYLGRDYDQVLMSGYTSIEPESVFSPRGILAALFDDALADSTPLYRTIETAINARLLERVAEEWTQKGRWLLVATTDLDARRQVIWNMGAIAASGHPQALDLFRRVLLASASIPGFFPPVMFDVEVDGQKYQEMHVDGGAIVQTFFIHSSFASEIRERDLVTNQKKTLYVIRNARLEPEWSSVDRQTVTIFGRAIAALLQSQGIDDLFRIYLHAQTDGVDFNLAFIEKDFEHKRDELFEREYMRALFDYGYEAGRQGYPWQKTPPHFIE